MEELVKRPGYYKAKRSKIVRIRKDHPFYRTSNKGNISESRLTMAIHLDRNLTKDDIVYIKDSNQSNISVDNLIVLTRREFATIRDLRRLKIMQVRLESKISVYEKYMIDAGIDPVTLNRSNSTISSRYREVDRDREAYGRGRRSSASYR